MNKKLLTGLLIFVSFSCFGQEKTITGIVLDKGSKTPIKNAHIIILGTTTGTISGDDGSFKLVSKKKIKEVVVSHIGYASSTISVSKKHLFVELLKTNSQLTQINIGLGEYTGPSSYKEFNEEIYLSTMTKNLSDDKFILVESSANFYGGMDNLYAFFASNFQYPKSVLEGNLKGRVFLQFIISADGTAIKPKILLGKEFNDVSNEILRVFDEMPKWYPARQEGVSVEESFILPISFAANR